MKRLHLRPSLLVLLASVVAVAGLALGLTGSARAQSTSVTPVRMVAFDCPGQSAPLVKPKTFILTCADANSDLGKLSWTSWTPGLASATGKLEVNDCNPYCAAGHFHAYSAVVVFWGNAAVKNHPGEHAYTDLTLILTGSRPRYYDYLTRKWVTAPATQTTALLTSPGALSPHT
jgi:hypothetical protein